MKKSALKKIKKITNKKKQKTLSISWKNLFQFLFMIPVWLFVIGSLAAATVGEAHAANNNQEINFQGKIVNKTSGTNITDGTYSFTFKIYDASSGGNQLWSETQSSVTVTNGIFEVALGSVTPLSSLNFTNPNLWLDITFNGENFGSRIQLGAVPTAIDALNLDGVVATQSAGGFNLAGGTSTVSTVSFTTSGSTLTVQPGNTGALTLQSNGANGLTLDTGGAAAVTIGASANAIIIGNNSSSNNTAITLTTGGSGVLTLGSNTGTGNVVVQPNAGGQAALVVNDFGAGDIFTASASGTTKFVVTNSGNIKAVAGAQIEPLSDSTTGLQIANADGTSLINFDTTNSFIKFGTGTSIYTGGTCKGSGVNEACAPLHFVSNTSNHDFIIENTGSNLLTLAHATGGIPWEWTFTVGSVQNGDFAIDDGNGFTPFYIAPNPNWMAIGRGFYTPQGVLDVQGPSAGNAALIVNQISDSANDIFTASASGSTKFTIGNSGAITDANYAGANAILYAAPTTGLITIATTTTGSQCLLSQTGSSGTPIWGSCNGSSGSLQVAYNTGQTIDLSQAGTGLTIGTNAGTQNVVIQPNAGGQAALVVDDQGSGDIFTASASGATKFVISNAGNVAIDSAKTNVAQFYVPGSVPTGAAGSVGTDNHPLAVAVEGSYAFVSNSGSNTLQSVDISNPGSPVVLQTLSLGSNTQGLFVQGKYAYVADDNGSLRIIDISNPSKMIILSTTTLSGGAEFMYVSGRYLYLSVDGDNTFQIFDIANPSAPVRMSKLSIGSTPISVTVQGNYAYVGNIGNNTIQAIDISHPSSPSIINTVSVAGAPYALTVQGRYLYVVNGSADSLQVFDIADPSTLSLVSTFSTNLSNPHGIVVQGRYVYVTNYGNATLEIIDVSNPSSLQSVGTVGTLSGPTFLSVVGRYAYIPARLSDTLQMFDLGGGYMQQLEAGGLVADNLNVTSNIFGQDAYLSGGLAVNESLFVASASAIASDLSVGGNVGIGTSTPSYTLDVQNSVAATAAAEIYNTNTSADSGGLVVKLGFSGNGTVPTSQTTGNTFVRFLNGDGLSLGAIDANGSGGITFATTGIDFAEYFKKENPSEVLDPGTIVCYGSTGGVTSCTGGTKMVGVVSDRPGFAGGTEHQGDPNYVLVGLLGQLPVKIAPTAVIHPGDSLTESLTGAVTATGSGQIIGTALEDSQKATEGKIMVHVNVEWYGLTNSYTSVASNSGTLVINNLLSEGLATVSGNLRVKGNSLVEGVLSVVDTLRTSNLIVSKVADFFDTVIFHDSVQFVNTPLFSKDTAGFAVVHKGSRRVDVTFANSYAQTPIIQASLTTHTTRDATESAQILLDGDYSYVITNESPTGFTIVLSKQAVEDVYFSWMALAVDKPTLFESKSTSTVLGTQITPTPNLLHTISSSSSAGNQSQ